MDITKYPQTIVLNTDELVREFKYATKGIIDPVDYIEIFTQIIYSLMNNLVPNDHWDQFKLDFSRLRNREFINDELMVGIVNEKVFELFNAIDNLLSTEYNAYIDGEFPYIFHSLLINDIVLDRLPY